MEDVLQLIISAIVSHPDEVSITRDTVDSAITFTVTTVPDDIGKIIGKDGRTIKAIRTLLKIIAEQQHQWVNIEVTQAS